MEPLESAGLPTFLAAGSDDVLRVALEPPTTGEVAIFVMAATVAFIGGLACSRNARLRRWLLVLLMFTPYVLPLQHINFMATHEVKGVSFSYRFVLVDISFIAFATSVLFSGKLRRGGWIPQRIWPGFLLLGMATLSMTTAIRPLFASFEVMNLIRGLIIFWIFYNAIQTEDDIYFFGKLTLAILAYFVLNTTYYYIQGYRSPWGGARGFLASKNGAALRIVLTAPLCLSFILVLKGHYRLWRWLVVLFLGAMVTLVLTDSRAGQGAFALALATVIYLSWRYFRDVTGKEQKYAMLAMLGIAGVLYFGPHVVERMNLGVEDASKTWRREANEMAYQAWQTSPITGIGLNNLSYWTRLESNETEQKAFTHNIYLLARAEMGLLGMFALLTLLLVPVHSAWKTVRFSVSNRVDCVALGMGAGILGMAFHGYFEPHLKGVEHQYLFWPNAAVATACYTLAVHKRKRLRVERAQHSVKHQHNPQPVLSSS